MAESPAPQDFDLDRMVAHDRLSGLALSPDGTRLVITVTTLDEKATGYVSALWEVDPAGQRSSRRLTRSTTGEQAPAFAHSGDLYFTSSRPDPDAAEDKDSKEAGLWRLPVGVGEAEPILRRPGGIGGITCAWSAETVLVSAPLLPGAVDEEQHARLHRHRQETSVKAILHSSYPIRHWDHDLGPAQPHLFALEQGSAEQENAAQNSTDHRLRSISAGIGSRYTGEVHLSPDGTTALMGETILEAGAERRSAVAQVDTATGERRIIADDPQKDFSPGPISPDGQYAIISVSQRPVPAEPMRPVLQLLDLESLEMTPLAEGADRWLSPASWLPDSSTVLALGDDDGRGPVWRISLATGQAERVTGEDSTFSEVIAAPDGATAYGVRSSYAYPSEIVRIDLSSGETTLLRNPTERPQLPGSLTEIETQAEDGVRIRSWLALPEGASAQSPAPLLLWIHGGPLNSWNAWSWRWVPWRLVAQGYAVLLPDPALSTGYGQDFIRRGWNSWGDKPFTDLMAITDAAEAREDIDETRTAAMGGSFGGYMANWVAGHTDRFKAIVTHASLWALDQFGPTTDMSPFWRRQIDTAMEEQHSPHHWVGDITTPMLVIHGDEDYRVPIGEGLRLWYELLADSGLPMGEDGSSPHRFLYFPDENHWILKPHQSVVWYQVVESFLAEHVLGADPQTASEQLPASLGLKPLQEEPDAEQKKSGQKKSGQENHA